MFPPRGSTAQHPGHTPDLVGGEARDRPDRIGALERERAELRRRSPDLDPVRDDGPTPAGPPPQQTDRPEADVTEHQQVRAHSHQARDQCPQEAHGLVPPAAGQREVDHGGVADLVEGADHGAGVAGDAARRVEHGGEEHEARSGSSHPSRDAVTLHRGALHLVALASQPGLSTTRREGGPPIEPGQALSWRCCGWAVKWCPS